MNVLKRRTVGLLRFFTRLNLFNSYSTDPIQLKREITTTRIYLILLPTLLTVLIIYSAQKEFYHTVQINNPSLDTYQQLLGLYPDTLVCPCSQLSIPYSSFVTLTPHYHPVCSSDLISDRWLEYLYYDDASFYAPYDIRCVGNAQFQLLRTLCQSSKQAVDNALQATFTSVTLVNSRGILLNSGLVRVQTEAFANKFIINIGSELRRRRTLFAVFLDRNFLVSGLKTSSTAVIDVYSQLKMVDDIYPEKLDKVASSDPYCRCDQAYTCATSLGIFNSSLYESDVGWYNDILQTGSILLETVDGFQSGCLPLNSLVQSTLQCYHDQSCLNNITSYLRTADSSFSALNRSVFNQSTSISTIADQLMVEEWSKEMNYTHYFAACRPSSCSYTYIERASTLYIITMLLGLLGGLMAILRIICPQITNVCYAIGKCICGEKAKNSSETLTAEQRQALKITLDQLLRKSKHMLLNLNLFARRNSADSEIREQILTTRFYIVCLLILTLILMSVTTLEKRIKTITISMPSINDFEDLYQSGKLPHSCPCSQIAIQRSEFITLSPTFHPICSSDLIASDWFYLLKHRLASPSSYYYLDVRSYGVQLFQTIASFCSLANETTTDAITSFLTSDLVTTQVLPRQQFNEQTQSLISDFQSNLENTFKQLFDLADETIQGNQLLTSKISNFFFDGLFNTDNHLISVKTYTGTMSSLNSTFPTCSCVLNRCSQQLGLYEVGLDGPTVIEVAGMYSACYPLNALRMSTLEYWFNESCIEEMWVYLLSVPIEPYFDPLNSSMLKRFSSTTTISEILDDVMIDTWTNVTNYENYYNICRPLTCTYTSYRRFDWLYTFTILTSVFGGLFVFLQIVCPWIMKFYFFCRRKRSANTANGSVIVRVGIISRVTKQVRHLILTLNIFDSDSPHEHIQRRERLSTRLYIILLAITVVFLFIYMLFVENIRTKTVTFPSSELVGQLNEKYETTLSCPCVKTAMPYTTFLSLKVMKLHPICSSSFVSRNYLETLLGDNLLVEPESMSFKRQFLAAQLSLLSSYCTLTYQTVNDSISLFLHQDFLTAQVLTADQFDKQMNASVNRFLLDLSLSLRPSLDYLQSIIHGNAIMSSYVSNWQFIPSSKVSSTTIFTRPVWYGNCSCASSRQCSIPMIIDNITFEGLSVGCLPSSVLLQSTLQCFYKQICLNRLHHTLFTNINISTLPPSINMSSRFPSNTSVGSLFDQLFIEELFHQYDYESFFRTCQVVMCTYTYNQRPDMLYVATTIIGLAGGLNVVFRVICPLVILGFIYLIDRIRNKSSTPVQIYTPPTQLTTDISTVQTTKTVTVCEKRRPVMVETQPPSSTHCCSQNHRYRIIFGISIFIGICVIIFIGINSRIKRSSSSNNYSFVERNTSNTSTIPTTTFCSARAKWKRQGVTVAGFADGTFSTSLSGLYYPSDIHIDSNDNMYIVDTNNHRILYWPRNSVEGRMVIGTGEPGAESNQLHFPSTLLVVNDQIYVADVHNYRVQSFALTTSAGSPDGTTVVGPLLLDSNLAISVWTTGMTFDRKRSSLYIINGMNNHLLVLNINQDKIQITADTKLYLMNGVTELIPQYITMDQTSDYFYVSSLYQPIVVKFVFNSPKGKTIADRAFGNTYYVQSWDPQGLAIDASGYLYIIDLTGNRIFQLQNETGILRTIAGLGRSGNSAIQISSPMALKFDQHNNLYVADAGNNRIQRFDLLTNGC